MGITTVRDLNLAPNQLVELQLLLLPELQAVATTAPLGNQRLPTSSLDPSGQSILDSLQQLLQQRLIDNQEEDQRQEGHCLLPLILMLECQKMKPWQPLLQLPWLTAVCRILGLLAGPTSRQRRRTGCWPRPCRSERLARQQGQGQAAGSGDKNCNLQ